MKKNYDSVKKKGMITYIIESQGFYKIGKTKNISTRLKCFNTHCFNFKLIKIIYKDIESLLHLVFAEKRVKLEWFNLDDEDLLFIDTLLLDLPDIEHESNNSNWESLTRDYGYRKVFSEHSRQKMSIAKGSKIAWINQDNEILQVFNSIKSASESTKKPATTIRSKCKNKTWFKDNTTFVLV